MSQHFRLFAALALLSPLWSGHRKRPWVDGADAHLSELMEKLEKDVMEFARQVTESSGATLCEMLKECEEANYDDCHSEYPTPSCPSRDDTRYWIPECGSSSCCNGLFDFTVSSVSLPKHLDLNRNGTPTDKAVVESICSSLRVEPWMKKRHNDLLEFFKDNGAPQETPQLYFGSATGGPFRIFPARHSKVCNAYDPRVRPWYIAATSGRKDVIIIMDTSGSVTTSWETLKTAALTLLDSLTESDQIAVVQLNDEPQLLPVAAAANRNQLVLATKQTKRELRTAIENLRPTGEGKVKAAFDTAFDAFHQMARAELHTDCNAALVFFTDSLKHESELGEVVSLFDQERPVLEEEMGGRLTLFAYSTGEEGSDDGEALIRSLACRTDGLWAALDNNDPKWIVENMSNFYRFFALGFGESSFQQDLSAVWVEPYEFATGGVLGTTVSYPVYATNSRFLGVVGMDFTMHAMLEAQALGSNDDDQTVRSKVDQAIRRKSQKQCPNLKGIQPCNLEVLRRETSAAASCSADGLGGTTEDDDGNLTTCTFAAWNNGSNAILACPNSNHSSNLFRNRAHFQKSYEERVCCRVGENVASLNCDDFCFDHPKTILAVAVVCGVLGGVIFLAGVAILVWRRLDVWNRQQSDEKSECGEGVPEEQASTTTKATTTEK